jgi:ornithine decarboxylase
LKRRFIDPFAPAEVQRLVATFGSPLLIIDCERIRAQYRKLARALPGVDLHYALKPLPHPAVVRTVAELGGFLDLATTGEVQLVSRLGIDPARCIHTHPIKRDKDFRNALFAGVKTFVADNPDEVRKFRRYRADAELLLRVSFRSPGAVSDLSRKFGCDPESALELARLAAKLGIRLKGFSFHVGSQARDALKHVEAIEACLVLLKKARREKLGPLDTLDIGGGFPIDYAQRVPEIGRFCAPHPQGAGWRAERRACDSRAGPVHRRACRHRRGQRHGPRRARGPVVVLPGRWPVWLVERADVRPRQLSHRKPEKER